MEEIFSHMDGRFEVTLTDSTMMWIVHCAMNKAQEKMKTKKGVIERLHEISKFYELAVMQLEGCLSFVQAETERSSVLDSNHEEVLADLREIKDRLQGRLEESEMAISKKDRELMEKLGKKDELKVKDYGEISVFDSSVDIHEVVESTRRKNDDGDDGDDDDFCGMKTCVDDNDQQMLISERLEPNGRILGEVPHSGIDIIKKVEEMGSDIDKLKQTMDVAFGKIQSALFFGEMVPKLEQQWKLTTEKEIMSILVKSYMREFQENIEAQVRTQGKHLIKSWWEHWSQLMNEVTSLRHELGHFIISQNEELMMTTYRHDDDYDQENIWNKISDQEMIQKSAQMVRSMCSLNHHLPSSIPEGMGMERHLLGGSPPVPEKLVIGPALVDTLVKTKKEESDKREKLPKEEEGTEDGSSNFIAKMVKKHQSIIRQKSQELNNISKYGVLLQEKTTAPTSPTKKEKDQPDDDSIKERIQNINARLDNLINWNSKVSEWLFDQRDVGKEIDEVSEYSLESSWDKMKGIFNLENVDQQNDKSVLNKEEKICKGMNEELHYESLNLDIEKQIEEGVCKYYLKEVINEWNECIERNDIENKIKEEIYFIIFSEATKDITNSTHEIENTIREDLSKLVFKKMVEEHNKILEDYSASMEYRFDEIQDYFLDLLHLVKIESLLKEDLQQFIMVETMKDAIISSMEVKSHVQSEEKLIKTLLESLLTCFEAEENLMLSARSEIKEHSRQLDLGSERGELHEHEILEDLLIVEEQTFWSLTSKVENALQQLGISKELLRELGTTLRLRQCNSEKNHNQNTTKEAYSDLLSFFNFLQTFREFEGMVNQKLEILTIRLENMKCCLDPVVELVDFLRNKESIFRKAFNIRCQNLQKAELEVDLLGDQVDALLTLLEKIYVTLYHYAPVLQEYFEVSNILELIKKQLTDEAV